MKQQELDVQCFLPEQKYVQQYLLSATPIQVQGKESTGSNRAWHFAR